MRASELGNRLWLWLWLWLWRAGWLSCFCDVLFTNFTPCFVCIGGGDIILSIV
jgi:hypothetical protein